MKIAVIGGGSTYTPELMDGLIERARDLGLSEVVLHDIDLARLDPVSSFCKRMVSHRGASFEIRATTDLDDAIKGARFVLTQIRVGGQEARHRDESLQRFGIVGQETTGAGGFVKSIRTIPKMLYIASRVRSLTPEAWVVNFTNPSGIVTEALLRHGGVKAVGLCNIPMEMKIETAKAFQVEPDAVELDYVGLNHLGFVRRVRINGEDITEGVLSLLSSGPANIPDLDFGSDLFAALRVLPSPYLRYYYLTEEVLGRPMTRTRAQEVMEIEAKLFEYYRDPATYEKPSLLALRGGAWYSRVAISVIEGLLSPSCRVEIVNTVNNGALGWLPDDAVIEAPADISSAGVNVRPISPVQEEVLGLIRQVKSYERLTIEAALTRSREKALAALLANPLVRTLEKARAVLRHMEQNGEWEA